MKTYSVQGRGAGCASRCETGRGHVMSTDTPAKDGGTDTAAEPVETMLAALIGCEQATAHFVGRLLRPRLVIRRIDFELQAERDVRGSAWRPIAEAPPVPAQVTRIWGSAKVAVDGDATNDDIAALGKIVHERCPVASMVRNSGCALEVRWELMAPSSSSYIE